MLTTCGNGLTADSPFDLKYAKQGFSSSVCDLGGCVKIQIGANSRSQFDRKMVSESAGEKWAFSPPTGQPAGSRELGL